MNVNTPPWCKVDECKASFNSLQEYNSCLKCRYFTTYNKRTLPSMPQRKKEKSSFPAFDYVLMYYQLQDVLILLESHKELEGVVNTIEALLDWASENGLFTWPEEEE